MLNQPVALFKNEDGDITILTKLHHDGPVVNLLRHSLIKFSTGRVCVIGQDSTIKTKYESVKVKNGRIDDARLILLLKEDGFEIQHFSEFTQDPFKDS